MDYQQMSMDLLCGVIDALPNPAVLLNRDGNPAYINPLGDELSLSEADFAGNGMIAEALETGMRREGGMMTLTRGKDTLRGTVSVYPVTQNGEIAGALLFFKPVEQEGGEVYPAGLPYVSGEISDVFSRIDRLSGINASVLFLGEEGVGKESFARELHRRSHRSALPFEAADCRPGAGGLNAVLADRSLRETYASAGTLFFDNVQALRPGEQKAMLEIIQTKKLGGYDLAARVCFSATPEMNAAAETGEFSTELKNRVSMMGVSVSPLRERQDDVPPLARHYLQKYGKMYGKKITDFSEDVWRYFLRHDWPRNLRDMELIIRESVADCEGDTVTSIPLAASQQVSLRRERHKFTYKRIETLLSVYGTTTEGKRRAAKELGIGLSSLYRIMANYQRDKKWGRID